MTSRLNEPDLPDDLDIRDLDPLVLQDLRVLSKDNANDVATVATGLAASMGQHLLSAGAKGKRYLTPHARVLMHQPSGGAGGSATDIRINADLIIKMKQELAEITAANTGHTVEEIIADSDRDHWFSAQEALEYGFVDHIVRSSREIGKQNGDN